MIVSDHSPCTPELKFLGKEEPNENAGNFLKAWGGISSLQFGKIYFYFMLYTRILVHIKN